MSSPPSPPSSLSTSHPFSLVGTLHLPPTHSNSIHHVYPSLSLSSSTSPSQVIFTHSNTITSFPLSFPYRPHHPLFTLTVLPPSVQLNSKDINYLSTKISFRTDKFGEIVGIHSSDNRIIFYGKAREVEKIIKIQNDKTLFHPSNIQYPYLFFPHPACYSYSTIRNNTHTSIAHFPLKSIGISPIPIPSPPILLPLFDSHLLVSLLQTSVPPSPPLSFLFSFFTFLPQIFHSEYLFAALGTQSCDIIILSIRVSGAKQNTHHDVQKNNQSFPHSDNKENLFQIVKILRVGEAIRDALHGNQCLHNDSSMRDANDSYPSSPPPPSSVFLTDHFHLVSNWISQIHFFPIPKIDPKEREKSPDDDSESLIMSVGTSSGRVVLYHMKITMNHRASSPFPFPHSPADFDAEHTVLYVSPKEINSFSPISSLEIVEIPTSKSSFSTSSVSSVWQHQHSPSSSSSVHCSICNSPSSPSSFNLCSHSYPHHRDDSPHYLMIFSSSYSLFAMNFSLNFLSSFSVSLSVCHPLTSFPCHEREISSVIINVSSPSPSSPSSSSISPSHSHPLISILTTALDSTCHQWIIKRNTNTSSLQIIQHDAQHHSAPSSPSPSSSPSLSPFRGYDSPLHCPFGFSTFPSSPLLFHSFHHIHSFLNPHSRNIAQCVNIFASTYPSLSCQSSPSPPLIPPEYSIGEDIDHFTNQLDLFTKKLSRRTQLGNAYNDEDNSQANAVGFVSVPGIGFSLSLGGEFDYRSFHHAHIGDVVNETKASHLLSYDPPLVTFAERNADSSLSAYPNPSRSPNHFTRKEIQSQMLRFCIQQFAEKHLRRHHLLRHPIPFSSLFTSLRLSLLSLFYLDFKEKRIHSPIISEDFTSFFMTDVMEFLHSTLSNDPSFASVVPFNINEFYLHSNRPFIVVSDAMEEVLRELSEAINKKYQQNQNPPSSPMTIPFLLSYLYDLRVLHSLFIFFLSLSSPFFPPNEKQKSESDSAIVNIRFKILFTHCAIQQIKTQNHSLQPVENVHRVKVQREWEKYFRYEFFTLANHYISSNTFPSPSMFSISISPSDIVVNVPHCQIFLNSIMQNSPQTSLFGSLPFSSIHCSVCSTVVINTLIRTSSVSSPPIFPLFSVCPSVPSHSLQRDCYSLLLIDENQMEKNCLGQMEMELDSENENDENDKEKNNVDGIIKNENPQSSGSDIKSKSKSRTRRKTPSSSFPSVSPSSPSLQSIFSSLTIGLEKKFEELSKIIPSAESFKEIYGKKYLKTEENSTENAITTTKKRMGRPKKVNSKESTSNSRKKKQDEGEETETEEDGDEDGEGEGDGEEDCNAANIVIKEEKDNDEDDDDIPSEKKVQGCGRNRKKPISKMEKETEISPENSHSKSSANVNVNESDAENQKGKDPCPSPVVLVKRRMRGKGKKNKNKTPNQQEETISPLPLPLPIPISGEKEKVLRTPKKRKSPGKEMPININMNSNDHHHHNEHHNENSTTTGSDNVNIPMDERDEVEAEDENHHGGNKHSHQHSQSSTSSSSSSSSSPFSSSKTSPSLSSPSPSLSVPFSLPCPSFSPFIYIPNEYVSYVPNAYSDLQNRQYPFPLLPTLVIMKCYICHSITQENYLNENDGNENVSDEDNPCNVMSFHQECPFCGGELYQIPQ